MIRAATSTDATVLARLSHAIRRRANGDDWPLISSENLDKLWQEPLPSARKQMNLLLAWIAEQVGDDRFKEVEIHDENIAGVIGAMNGDSASVVVNTAERHRFIEFLPDNWYSLTVEGWDEVERSSYIKKEKQMIKPSGRVFIGHGRSRVWKDLKDYLHERLSLPWEEFNRESVAGHSTVDRLRTMLDGASFAFIVMTAEDDTIDGKKNPRLNVVHEAGLFQGKLGFEKAIVLLEDGCEDFSNIDGLGQIRFPAGNIEAKFEEIRKVLEREGLLPR